jgi:hypothetical protein
LDAIAHAAEELAQLEILLGQLVQERNLRGHLRLVLSAVLGLVALVGRRFRRVWLTRPVLGLHEFRHKLSDSRARHGWRRGRRRRHLLKALGGPHPGVGDGACVHTHDALEALGDVEVVFGGGGDGRANLGKVVPGRWQRRRRWRGRWRGPRADFEERGRERRRRRQRRFELVGRNEAARGCIEGERGIAFEHALHGGAGCRITPARSWVDGREASSHTQPCREPQKLVAHALK